MPRLLGVEIPADKRIEASLTYIYGIGFSTARRILEQTNIDPNIRAKNLTPQQLNEIIHAITNNKIKIEGDLRRDVQSNLKRLQAINSYRGIRHRKGLPVRGQRTSTNARTRKGPRKTVGVIRNPEAKGGKNVHSGIAHVLATFNNTIVTITDMKGNVIGWSSAGKVGFKGSRKSTAYAAQMVAQDASRQAMGHGLKEVEVLVRGPGAGRESAVRALQAIGLDLTVIRDVTPVPHNGCRPPKPRRV